MRREATAENASPDEVDAFMRWVSMPEDSRCDASMRGTTYLVVVPFYENYEPRSP